MQGGCDAYEQVEAFVLPTTARFRPKHSDLLLSVVSERERLATLAKIRMRAKLPRLREALESRFVLSPHGITVARLITHPERPLGGHSGDAYSGHAGVLAASH